MPLGMCRVLSAASELKIFVQEHKSICVVSISIPAYVSEKCLMFQTLGQTRLEVCPYVLFDTARR